MIENTVQKIASDDREQELTQEVLRLQETVDTLIAQREMLQRELFKRDYLSNTTDD